MKRSSQLMICLLLGGCSCEAVVAMEEDGGGVDSATPTSDAGEVDGGREDAGRDGDGGDGDARVCVDADSDGVTDCDGDCDDADPLTFPGATEICGDGVDNACGDDPDPAARCAGLGTYVSAAGDDASGDGTRDNPVRSVAQGIANAVTIGGPNVVVVAGGDYPETVQLVEGVSIRGGFECPSLPCSWASDPSANETVIDGGATANAMEAGDTITRATRVEDLSLRSGRAGFLIRDAAPTALRLNVAAREGINAFGAVDPRIEDCVVVGTSVGVSIEGDGEILTSTIEGAPAVSVRGPVLVQRNVVHAAGDTGIWIGGSAIVDANLINDDASRVGTCSFGFCSGISIWGGSPVITNNVVHGMGGASSSAISIVHGELSVEEPIIHSNTLYAARVPGGAGSINAGVSCNSFFGLAEFGELRNNIIIGAGAGTSYGFYEEDHSPGRQCRPVLMENNDFFDVDHVARFWGSPETLYTSVSDADAQPWASSNLSADPMLDATHHLGAGSPCVDRGVAIEAPPLDRDGDPRPAGAGYDIGADERP